MNTPTHIIDPDGEVIIILRNADCPFAQPAETPTSGDSDQGLDGEAQSPVELSKAQLQSLEEKTLKKGKLDANLTAPESTSPNEEPAAEEDLAASPDLDCLRIQVSAKHLMFASPVFKRMLTGGWKESILYAQKGSVEVTAESWDVEALLILLRAIHGQYHLVPRELTLEMLAKVAVITDYYGCKETLCLLTDVWIKNLKENIPATVNRDLILWLWISWFFQLPSQFKSSTSIAMSGSNGWIDSLGLPISDKVIDSMNERREKAISNVIARLYETRDAFLHGTIGCSFECRSIMYGALSIQMQSNNLLSPKPETPFLDLNCNCLVRTVKAFKSPEWWDDDDDEHACYDSSLPSLFSELEDSLGGLQLNEFTA
ncbi:uncharacterized protein N7515_004500 [Penicillium bovifimosum]|uniref:BTB domain-containing protein n=1 Tax=Penicillium bovifimosum TaxID=126998 RepID=A0A9W9H077_9EURO|nr:uncharacterized protein N7515_004500 [Penicillium bovifimosum]KAJ5135222.1 hypothetical protein N7515_004500 [Penicillium bovifimosum]